MEIGCRVSKGIPHGGITQIFTGLSQTQIRLLNRPQTQISQNGNQANWSSRNPQNNQANSYVPPHQRGYLGRNANQQQGGQSYNNYQGNPGNFHHNQGPRYNQQGSGSSQPYPRQSRNTDDLVGDLLNSQQHIQSNTQANNDVVHKLQDAHQEQKAAMDMLAKQLS
ncbi:hypothetical protein AAHA92_09719 [Salvia divinorum]|uniref:Uncharacterized protein n=1 Tax=Salvia divinorum TaxID=28513 RepID=A0ABD1HTU6_SALDI